jgi:DNA-binding PadR family transcriptional regulator
MRRKLRLSSEQYCFQGKTRNDTAIQREPVSETKTKLLKACLDKAILAEMTQRDAISASDIIATFKKKYDIRISPGTLYPVLYAMERNGKIRRLPNKRKKFYVLTASGRRTVENTEHRADEFQSFISDLIVK